MFIFWVQYSSPSRRFAIYWSHLLTNSSVYIWCNVLVLIRKLSCLYSRLIKIGTFPDAASHSVPNKSLCCRIFQIYYPHYPMQRKNNPIDPGAASYCSPAPLKMTDTTMNMTDSHAGTASYCSPEPLKMTDTAMNMTEFTCMRNECLNKGISFPNGAKLW